MRSDQYRSPEVLLRECLHPAQLASEKASTHSMADWSANFQMSRGLPNKYFPMRSSLLQDPVDGVDVSLQASLTLN